MSRPPTILGRGFGFWHETWVKRPLLAAVVAFVCYAIAAIFSLVLHIGWTFTSADGTERPGFLQTHWGPLFLIGMPAATSLIGYYFQALERALGALDQIIKPSRNHVSGFTEYLGNRFRLDWTGWMHPVAILVSVLLVILADGRDIAAPLQSRVLPHSSELDWSTVGYQSQPAISPMMYLAFNIVAFALEGFLAYCGFLLLILTSRILVLLFKDGLNSRRVKRETQYHVQWAYDDETGRCGLHQFDKVFAIYLLLLFVSVALALWSVLAQATPDRGSAILIVANLFLLPFVFFWIAIPYWKEFPRSLPSQYKDKGYIDPQPWPFGAEKIVWAVVAFAVSSWLYLAKEGWEAVAIFLALRQ